MDFTFCMKKIKKDSLQKKSMSKDLSSSDNVILLKSKIFSEDDYFEATSSSYYHFKCDLSPQTIPGKNDNPFHFYSQFRGYLQRKSDIELVNRLVESSKEMISPGLEYYSDEVLREELEQIYGGTMSESSERFQLIFQTYKNQRLEQLEGWMELGREEKLDLVGSEFLDERIELLKYYSEEELDQFEDPSEKFVLPRIQASSSAKASPKKHGNNKEQLISVVESILREHPLGITKTVLSDKLSESSKSLPKLSPPLMKELSKKNVLFTEDPLVFPGQLKGCLQDSTKILWSLKHRVEVILSLSFGILEVNECVQLLLKVFHIKYFAYVNYGFSTPQEFLQFLVHKWKLARELEVIQMKGKYYICEMTKDRRELVRKQKSASASPSHHKTINNDKGVNGASQQLIQTSAPSPWNKTNPKIVAASSPQQMGFDPNLTSIPPQFVQMGENLAREQNGISQGALLDCVVAYFNSPTSFYVVRKSMWRDLGRLLSDLRKVWCSSGSPPNPKFLHKNYLCLAKPFPHEDEVYRVAITGRPDRDHYQVFCVDYGDVATVPLQNLRFLPREYLETLEAQAVSCSLYNVASREKNEGGRDLWGENVRAFAKALFSSDGCEEPVVKVHFKEKVLGDSRWLVKVSVLPKYPDLGLEVMRYYNNT